MVKTVLYRGIPRPDIKPSPRTIWKRPCPNCPSAHYPPDPEAEDISAWYKAGKIPVWDAIFPCAWRPQKMCRGVCDVNGVTEADLQGPEEHVL